MGTHPIVIGGKMSEMLDAARNVVLSDDAVAKIKALFEQEGCNDLRLRVAIRPGGCSRFTYQPHFDEREPEGDAIRDFGGVEVIADKMFEPCLDGATIGFTDSIDRQGFAIDNPNTADSCVCGDSFH